MRLDPGEAGEFGFACGMNMIHGTLIVEPAAGGAASGSQDQAAAVTGVAATPEADGMAAGAPAGDAEEAEWAAEIADLALRVLAGAALNCRCCMR